MTTKKLFKLHDELNKIREKIELANNMMQYDFEYEKVFKKREQQLTLYDEKLGQMTEELIFPEKS